MSNPTGTEAHHLPCTIHHRGKASAGYLNVDKEIGLRSFRGRKLEKGKFDVPDSHALLACELEEDGTMKVKYKLNNEGAFYNHDDPATQDSPLPNSLNWFKLAASIHAPLSSSDVEKLTSSK